MTHADRAADAGNPALAAEITAYYERGMEDSRLREGDGRLEFWRTQDVLRRLLPQPPARVLDVGGGSGVHAEWLAADGHRVDLIDPVQSHVEQAARLPRVGAYLGDARSLDVPDGSADVVLLLGPLYHLTAHSERVTALAEANRVLRPGGLVVAATINRFAGLHDTLNKGSYFDPELRPGIEAAAHDGWLRATSGEKSTFTTAYLHQPEEVLAEFTAAGLTITGQYGLEGAAWLMGSLDSWLDEPGRRELVLQAMRRTESVPSLLGISSHLLTAGRKRDAPGSQWISS